MGDANEEQSLTSSLSKPCLCQGSLSIPFLGLSLGLHLLSFFQEKKKKNIMRKAKSTGGSPIEQKTVGPAVTECKVAV